MRYAVLLLLFAIAAAPVQGQGLDGFMAKPSPHLHGHRSTPRRSESIKSWANRFRLIWCFASTIRKSRSAPAWAASRRCWCWLIIIVRKCVRWCSRIRWKLSSRFRETSATSLTWSCVSFDPKDMPGLAYELKMKFLKEYGRAGADKGLHFLCGQEEPIKELCDAVGFRYEYDKERKQYNHASGITIVTPYGKRSKYIFGVAYEPKEVQAALEGSRRQNRQGNPKPHFSSVLPEGR